MRRVSTETQVGSAVCVATPLSDGTHSLHLGRIVEVTPTEICLEQVTWVGATGRHHKFFAGDYDKNTELEVYPPTIIKRLPRWGDEVTDWPYPLPTESR